MLWIRLLIWLKGEFVGQDSFGNKYYRKKGPESLKERRWIIYKGIPEASKVPAEWHGWLHHTTLWPPSAEVIKRWPWEKNHLPNFTGTPYAYTPLTIETEKDITTKNYEAWKPHKGEHENKPA